MPSQLHEALVELFRGRPVLALELLDLVRGSHSTKDASVEIIASSFADARPPEYSADLVLRARASERSFCLVLEVQLDADGADRQAKRSAWPRYAVWQWADTQLPAYLVVVTPSRRVERWAAEPIEIGHPGFVLSPIVLGPSNVPAHLDLGAAPSSPELAVLSAVVHSRAKQAVQIAAHAVNAALAIEPDKRKLFIDVVLAVLPRRARKEVEAIMLEKYEYQSEYARRYVAEGRAEGKAEDVLRVLEARGFAVPKDVAERVLACRDLETLDAWLVRAATLADLDAVLGSG